MRLKALKNVENVVNCFIQDRSMIINLMISFKLKKKISKSIDLESRQKIMEKFIKEICVMAWEMGKGFIFIKMVESMKANDLKTKGVDMEY